ncbi:hypothetical protein FNU79_13130 [Deinococcus detaillensis]|uniref:Uncharacterized protein n=1 Tax=Deinococcus detaillensis TaxID=2592048 RepID=A0A553US55_9DEIO|nr:hypothetical protein [Deinococcus detaillensis]TSA83053.1 hypothetical protein FNU79_13130 [Deinococcus detaillensis]
MRATRRERAWTASRTLELIYMIVFVALFFVGYWQRPLDAWVYWSVAAAATMSGFWIWIRQYRALDELGKLKFMKSWMVAGMVTSTGLSALIGWTIFNAERSVSVPPSLSFMAAYGVLMLGLLAMALTNWILNRGTSERRLKGDRHAENS